MANGQASNGPRAAKVQKQRKKHKVVLESAGDKGDDDKLRVVVRKTIRVFKNPTLIMRSYPSMPNLRQATHSYLPVIHN